MVRAVVVDASAVVDALLDGDLLDGDLLAPGHLPVECASAMARLERARLIDRNHADLRLRSLARMPVTLFPTSDLLTLAWSLRHAVSVSDSFYVACALAARRPLLTHDLRLARAAADLGVDVQDS